MVVDLSGKSQFNFQPRWKEELVVSCAQGAFVLEMPMGKLSVYLPTEISFLRFAPHWAREMWPVLKAELEAWCDASNAVLFIVPNAGVIMDDN